MRCSNCRSESIQKLSPVYESGVTLVDTTTMGGGVGAAGGLGIGFAGAATRGRHITAISAKAAPPRKKSYGPAIAWLLISLPLALFLAWPLLLTAIAIGIIVIDAQWNKKEWPKLYAVWDARYLCNRCGAMMVPTRTRPTPVTGGQRSHIETIEHPSLPQDAGNAEW